MSFVSLLMIIAASPPSSPTELLREAETAYQSGLDDRDDEKEARPWFRRSAEIYDRLWYRYHVDHPRLHQARAQAYLLADDFPRALRAYHEGITRWPTDQALRQGREYARGLVSYPDQGPLRELARPREPWRPSDWIAPSYLQLLTGIAYLLGWVCFARARMTRHPDWWLLCAVMWLWAMVGGLGLWWEAHLHEQAKATPWAVTTEPGVVLRQGNAHSYPARLDDELPLGVEMSVLHQRGGWVQIRLSSGIVGWLPREAILIAQENSHANKP